MDNQTDFIDELGIDRHASLGNLCESVMNIRQQLGDNPDMVIIEKSTGEQLETSDLMVVKKEDFNKILDAAQARISDDVKLKKRIRVRRTGARILSFALAGALVIKPEMLQELTEKVSPGLLIPFLVGLYAIIQNNVKEDDEKFIYNTYHSILDKVVGLCNSRIKDVEEIKIKG